jgi:hypothetical protein
MNKVLILVAASITVLSFIALVYFSSSSMIDMCTSPDTEAGGARLMGCMRQEPTNDTGMSYSLVGMAFGTSLAAYSVITRKKKK